MRQRCGLMSDHFGHLLRCRLQRAVGTHEPHSRPLRVPVGHTGRQAIAARLSAVRRPGARFTKYLTIYRKIVVSLS